MTKLINTLRKFNPSNEDHVLALYEAYDTLHPGKRDDSQDPLEAMSDKRMISTAKRYATALERIKATPDASPIEQVSKQLKRDPKAVRAQLRRLGYGSGTYQAKTVKQIIRILEQRIAAF